MEVKSLAPVHRGTLSLECTLIIYFHCTHEDMTGKKYAHFDPISQSIFQINNFNDSNMRNTDRPGFDA